MHLCKISASLEEIIRRARRRPSALRNFRRSVAHDINTKNFCGAFYDFPNFFRVIKLKAECTARKTRTKRGREKRDARSGGDQRKRRKVQLNRARRRSFTNDNIQRSRLHCRAKHFLA